MTVSKLSKGLGRTKAGIKVFQDIDSEKKQAATTRQDSKEVKGEVFFCQTMRLSLHVISTDLCTTTCISGQFTYSNTIYYNCWSKHNKTFLYCIVYNA